MSSSAKEVLAGHVRRLADSGIGVLLVEQKVFEALDVADWAHVLVAGRPKMEGRPGDLLQRADLRDVFLGAAAEPGFPAGPAAQLDAGGDADRHP